MSTTAPSPFTALDDAFVALSQEPRPLAFDASAIDGMPDRAIPLGELRTRLLNPRTSFATRNAVIGELVRRAKEQGGAATIALAGMLLPGLRRAAYPLVRACPERAGDIEADMLAGFLAGLADLSPTHPRLAHRLVALAFNAGKRGVRKELAERGRVTHAPGAQAPQPPFGHPDLVLWAAALEGVISPDDAELIGTTRLEGVSLKRAAHQRGIEYKTAAKRRDRAEERLLAVLGGPSVLKVSTRRGAIADGAVLPDDARSVEPCPVENGHSSRPLSPATAPRTRRRFDRRSE